MRPKNRRPRTKQTNAAKLYYRARPVPSAPPSLPPSLRSVLKEGSCFLRLLCLPSSHYPFVASPVPSQLTLDTFPVPLVVPLSAPPSPFLPIPYSLLFLTLSLSNLFHFPVLFSSPPSPSLVFFHPFPFPCPLFLPSPSPFPFPCAPSPHSYNPLLMLLSVHLPNRPPPPGRAVVQMARLLSVIRVLQAPPPPLYTRPGLVTRVSDEINHKQLLSSTRLSCCEFPSPCVTSITATPHRSGSLESRGLSVAAPG